MATACLVMELTSALGVERIQGLVRKMIAENSVEWVDYQWYFCTYFPELDVTVTWGVIFCVGDK